MPNLHDIERRINSVTSTKQITRTMEMVAAAKIRRASDRAVSALPWAYAISDMVIATAKYAPLDSEPLLQRHTEIRTSLIMVVTSDRGLAGGFNTNVLRRVESLMEQKRAAGIDVKVIACGRKAMTYFNYRGITPDLEYAGLSADPTYEQAATISRYVGDAYHYGQIDEFVIVYNHAKNAAEQSVIEQHVLPISQERYNELLGITGKDRDVFESFMEKDLESLPGDIAFEPDADNCMFYLLKLYMRNAVFFALLDSAAAEQGARRNAMKSATDNANEMVETLTRVYNRARQGAITTEITEIVGGAAALEE